MKKLQELFRRVDEVLFKQIDALMSNVAYQKVTDRLAQLEEPQQKIVAQAVALGLVFMPFAAVVFMAFSNAGIRRNVNIYKDIVTEVQAHNQKSGQLMSAGQGLLAPNPIQGKEALETKLRSALNTKNIPSEKVSVVSFEEGGGNALRSGEAEIRFSDLTLPEMTELVQILSLQERFRILSVRIQKSPTGQRLSGDFRARHLARAQGGE